MHNRQSSEVRGRDPQDFWLVVVGSRGRVAKYYFMLSCTVSMFESGDFFIFKRNRITS